MEKGRPMVGEPPMGVVAAERWLGRSGVAWPPEYNFNVRLLFLCDQPDLF